MDPEPTDPDLLLLSLNLSDSEPDEAAAPATQTPGSAPVPSTAQPLTRAERTALSEEAFQALKQTYRAKVENGNLYKTIPSATTTLFPPSSDSDPSDRSPPPPLTKPEAQALLHAAEELYFFRRYETAVAFLRSVLGEEGGHHDRGDADVNGSVNGNGGANGDVNGDGDRDRRGGGDDIEGGSRGVDGGSRGKGSGDKRGKGAGRIDGETERLLRYYLQRSIARAREGPSNPGRVLVSS